MNKLTNEYLEACAVDDTPAFDSLEIQEILIDQKLRELIEQRQERWKKASYMTEEEQHTFDELQKLLEGSKK